MALIGNSTNIPTNTGKIIAVHGGTATDLTKVIANGVVVWEKQIEIKLIDGSNIQPGYTFNWWGDDEKLNDISNYISAQNDSILLYSDFSAPDPNNDESTKITSTITWNNIDVTNFSKLKLTFSVEAETSEDGYADMTTYFTCGSLISQINEGTARYPWGGNKNNYIWSGTIELDISSLSGNQTIQIVQMHGSRGYDDENGERYLSWSWTYFTNFELS